MENLFDKQVDESVEKVAELEKTQISKTESKPNAVMTVGDNSPRPGHNMVAMTVGVTSSASTAQQLPSDRVKVKIEYPKGWKKDRHLPDGSIREVSPESADQFIKLGIASIVEPDKKQ